MIQSPQHFVSNQAIAVLGSGWEASYAAANRSGILTIDDRVSLCNGICHVLAALPANQQAKSLLALAMPSLDCLEAMLQHANDTTGSRQEHKNNVPTLNAILDRVASEIIIVSTIVTSFSKAARANEGHHTNNDISIQVPALGILKRAWPLVSMAAKQFNDSDVRMLYPTAKSTGFCLSNYFLVHAVIDSRFLRLSYIFFLAVFLLNAKMIYLHRCSKSCVSLLDRLLKIAR